MFVVVGKAVRGRFKGQEVIMGNLRDNSLIADDKAAKDWLDRIRTSLENQKNPDVDPSSLYIATVRDRHHQRTMDL